MRFSPVMLLHYVTAILILAFGAVHLATHSFLDPAGYSGGIAYFTVISHFWNPLYAASLEGILVTVAYHGFNGVRNILLEFRQDRNWNRVVTLLLLLLGTVVVVYGTRTILIVSLGWR